MHCCRYNHAGIDDGWQLCNSGPEGTGFHNASGFPMVNTSKFPDLRQMTAFARSLGVIPGWYANNCHCADHSATCSGHEACYTGDVAATVTYGFASLKVDACGVQKNVSDYAERLNRTGVAVLLENCHEGTPHVDGSGNVVCPMNLFRTSADIRPTFGAIITNLLTVDKYNSGGLTGPSCWAYPDMLEVGVTVPQPPGAVHHCETPAVPCRLNATEWQTHFSAWAINSAPLVLGMDLTDPQAVDAAWPVIANPEVIAVNQQWAGDTGRLVSQSSSTVAAPNCGHGTPCQIPRWLVYAKRLPVPAADASWARSTTALLLINGADTVAHVAANLSTSVPGLGSCTAGTCQVRDVAARVAMPNITGGVLGATLPPHASLLAVISSPYPWTPPSPPPPAPPAPPASCKWIPGAGLKGSDIGHPEAGSASKEACCAACAADSRCKAACFRPASHTGPGGPGCHMKAALDTDPGGAGDADAVVCIPERSQNHNKA